MDGRFSEAGVPSMLDSHRPQKQSAATAFKPAWCGNHAPVNTKKLSIACAVASGLFLPSCLQQDTPNTQTEVFRLFDLFQPDDLTGKVSPDDVGWKRPEWRAQEM